MQHLHQDIACKIAEGTHRHILGRQYLRVLESGDGQDLIKVFGSKAHFVGKIIEARVQTEWIAHIGDPRKENAVLIYQ